MAENIIDTIYGQLRSLFGSDRSQLFLMEFPGRVLDPDLYGYPVDDAYAQITKPQPVVEAEFRLTNDLFDPAQVTGGPNGRKLSVAYDVALNALVPAIAEEQVEFMEDRQRVRRWLEEEVEAELPDDDGNLVTRTLTRMELYDALHRRYIDAAEEWRLKKEENYQAALDADDPHEALEDYARWVSRHAPIAEEELESLFADLVVRGNYHEVREMLGLIDVKSPAEELEQTKAHLRASEGTSTDETQSIWPVQLQPADWFKSLDTSFAPVDLLLDPQSLQTELVVKQTELEQLEEQSTLLGAAQSGDVTALKAAVENARTALDTATSAVMDKYHESAVTVARIYLKAKYGGGATAAGLTTALEKANAKKSPTGMTLTDNDVQDLLQKATAVNNAQQALTAASSRLAEAQAALAGAKASEQTMALSAVQARKESLRRQIKYLESILTSQSAAPALEQALTEDGTFDATKTPAFTKAAVDGEDGEQRSSALPDTIPGNWVAVIVKHDESEESSESTLTTSSSVSKANLNLFLGGFSGQSATSEATSTAKIDASNLNIKIGMLATKVEIDRSGWFNPQIFAGSKSMFHIDGSEEDRKLISDGTVEESNRENILPTYPTAFVVVKDVTIVVAKSETHSDSYGYVKNTVSGASGGFLCFSASHSRTSSTQINRAYTAATDDAVVIRIPQPQILAWFVEPVARDESRDYERLPDSFLAAATTRELSESRERELERAPAAMPALTAAMEREAAPAAPSNGGGAAGFHALEEHLRQVNEDVEQVKDELAID